MYFAQKVRDKDTDHCIPSPHAETCHPDAHAHIHAIYLEAAGLLGIEHLAELIGALDRNVVDFPLE